MSVIKAGTTVTTALVLEGNTDGDLIFKTGSAAVTAMSISASGVVTFPATTGFDIASANITNLTSRSLTVSAATYLASASGNVGIGTSSPDQKLVVTGQQRILSASTSFTSTGKGIELFYNSGDDTSYFQSYDRAANSYKAIKIRGSTIDFTSGTGSNTLTFDSSGNLGLGVTPAAWGTSTFIGLQVGANNSAALVGRADSTSDMFLGCNVYWANGDFRYIAGGTASYYRQNAGTHTWINATSGTATSGLSQTQILSISSGNSLALQGASSQSGAGITFPATQSASSNANTLDDYEEGTFTPTVVTTTGTPTYSYQVAYYTKIGRQVFGGGIIGISNSNSLTGSIRIGGLPFTIAAGTYGYTGGTVSDGSGFTFPVGNGFYNVYLQAANGATNFEFVGVGTTATVVNYNSAGIDNSWYFRFMFSYYT